MTAGAAARPAPSCPRVESIWAFPEGYEVTARAATETATRLLSNQGRPEAWIPGELFGTDIPPPPLEARTPRPIAEALQSLSPGPGGS